VYSKPLTAVALTRKPELRRIGIVAYPAAEILDITGPYEVFSFAGLALQREGYTDKSVYQVEILASEPGPVTTLTGLKIIADRTYGSLDGGIDTLIVPGSLDMNTVVQDHALLDWIRSIAPSVRRLASVCTGAFILAECGLLDNRPATTHWNWSSDLAKKYPSVKVEPDNIYIRSGGVYTSGGITSGIDLVLAMVEEDWGRELALYVARYLVMFLKRPGGQSQFSKYLTNEAHHRKDIRELQAWIIANPTEELHVDNLAERMAMSPRNFARTFLTETGVTPAKYVEMARIDAARQYLENTELSIEAVAAKAGFGDTERMRRCFLKHIGVNPHDYRKRFSAHTDDHGMPLYA